MKDWRGVIVQLATLAAVVLLVGMSKGADPGLVHFALGVVGGSYGVALARARSDAASSGGGSGGSGTGLSGPPGAMGRSLPPSIGGLLGFLAAFAAARVFLG